MAKLTTYELYAMGYLTGSGGGSGGGGGAKGRRARYEEEYELPF